jgi:3D (Asp-Asp-Asp) domain-containing protein
LFPAHALAFNNDLEQSHLKLIFTLDPALEGIAVVGIEEYPKPKTFARVLKDDSLDVRASLIAGSKVRVLSLAYSSTLDQTDANPYITANGARVGPGTMAANFLPLGTSVRIGNMIYVINDRMNERFNNKYVVDIWKPTRQEAINHGARILEMEIVSLP